MKVLCFATQGTDSSDEQRIVFLLQPLHPQLLSLDRSRKSRLPQMLLAAVFRRRPDVIVMEGSGIAGGLAVIGARLLFGVPYVVSSGDAVGPFLRSFHPATWPVAALYERMLVGMCEGFIGWSPYLVGRALSFGAPRGMTAGHFSLSRPKPGAREVVRRELGIPEEAIVIGIVGRIVRDPRGYSYGMELIRALRRTERSDLRILVVGEGDGLTALADLAGADLGRRVLLTGGCERERVADHLAAMDVGVLSQSTDLIGAVRYTTKLPEYLAAGLPVIVTQTPLGYDLDGGWLWRLPGEAPWDEEHIAALSQFMREIRRDEIARRRAQVPKRLDLFDPWLQQERVCAFVQEATARHRARRH